MNFCGTMNIHTFIDTHHPDVTNSIVLIGGDDDEIYPYTNMVDWRTCYRLANFIKKCKSLRTFTLKRYEMPSAELATIMKALKQHHRHSIENLDVSMIRIDESMRNGLAFATRLLTLSNNILRYIDISNSYILSLENAHYLTGLVADDLCRFLVKTRTLCTLTMRQCHFDYHSSALYNMVMKQGLARNRTLEYVVIDKITIGTKYRRKVFIKCVAQHPTIQYVFGFSSKGHNLIREKRCVIRKYIIGKFALLVHHLPMEMWSIVISYMDIPVPYASDEYIYD